MLIYLSALRCPGAELQWWQEYDAIARKNSFDRSEDHQRWFHATHEHGEKEPDPLRQECELVLIARSILQQRRLRRDHFNESIFGEAAWEMLLELYDREASGLSSTASKLQARLAVPPSVAARWLRHLEKEGLAIARPHPSDAKTAFVELTARGRESLNEYLAALRDS